jgi:hypothetical protein
MGIVLHLSEESTSLLRIRWIWTVSTLVAKLCQSIFSKEKSTMQVFLLTLIETLIACDEKRIKLRDSTTVELF